MRRSGASFGPSRVRAATAGGVIVLALLSSAAGARPLDSAELRLTIRNDSIPFESATLAGVAPVGASLGNTGATLSSGSAFSGTELVAALTSPPLFDAIHLRVGPNAAGSFVGTPISGPATFTGTLSLETPGGWFVQVPLLFGGAGQTTVTGFVATGGTPLPATVVQAPFQTGVVTVGGTAGTPLIATGQNDLTPGGAGSLQLVAPVRIVSQLFDFQATAELELHFVPEPGTPTLLAWGVACLALLGRRRQLRRRLEDPATRC